MIEQRKLNKADKALYYWLKILANSIYGFFVELIPENQTNDVAVNVFSGERPFTDSSDVLEKSGSWFFPPLASLITSAGRLLLAMTEACVSEKQGTYLFCDTDSLAIVSSEKGGSLDIPGSEGFKVLAWQEVQEIIDRFISLNPCDPKAVGGSILNYVNVNYVDSTPEKGRRQLHGYSIAAKRYALYERVGDRDINIVNTKGLLRRVHVIAGEFRYVGKETDRKWEEGDEISILEFAATEYGRTNRIVASEEVKNDIKDVGINKCARESGFDRKNFIRKLVRGIPIKRNSYNEFLRWLNSHKSQHRT